MTTEQEVERLLEAREKMEKENDTQTVELEMVEKLQMENISLQQALLQEKMIANRQRLEMLAAVIKARIGAPKEAQLHFDPQNLNSVQIVTALSDGESSE